MNSRSEEQLAQAEIVAEEQVQPRDVGFAERLGAICASE